MSKYGNKKVRVNGVKFDSQKEYKRHGQLSLLEKAGAIKDLRMQVKYVLIPAQYEAVARYGKKGQRLKDGKKLLEKEVSYIADFQYYDNRTGELVVEDVKSEITRKNPLYVAKRKMMLYFHGIRIKEM